jgi:hypothetical protein
MFEALLNIDYVAPYNPLGPGPTTLQYGDSTLGYYGEVTGAEFFTEAEVSGGIGLTAGAIFSSAPYWIKMIIDGVIIYIPKMPLRSGIKWDEIYAAKAVYGIKGNGKYPPGGVGVMQNAQLVKNGYRYKVRLGSTGNDPTTLPSPNASTTASYASTEWGRITNALVTPKRTGAGWGLYNIGTMFAGHVVTKNTYNGNTTMAVTVENTASPAVNAYSKTTATSTWLPILELTTDDTWGNP